MCVVWEEKRVETYAMEDWNQCSIRGLGAAPWEGVECHPLLRVSELERERESKE